MSLTLSYTELISQGWEFVSNLTKADANDLMDRLEISDVYEYKIGEPKDTGQWTVEQLKDTGMVGFYKRGGKKEKRVTLDPPTPFHVEPPVLSFPYPGRSQDTKPLEVRCT